MINWRQNKQSFSFIILLVAILAIPLPKAGMMEASSMVFSWLIALAFALHLFEVNKKNNITSYSRRYFSWLLVFFVMTIWISLQIFVFPYIFGWKLFFPDDIPNAVIQAQAANRLQSLHYWALFTTYWAIVFLVSRYSRAQMNILLWCIVAALLFQVLYGITADVKGYETILGLWKKEAYLGDATGTFVNHNHFAGFIGVSLPLVLAFVLQPLIKKGSLIFMSWRIYFALFILVVSLIALILSNSRMGIFSSFTSLLIFYWFSSSSRYFDVNGWIRVLIPFGMGIFILIVALWLGSEEIFARFIRIINGTSLDGRTEIWLSMFDAPLLTWLFGAGAGAFSDVYQITHAIAPLTYQEAHNDYLQFIFEFGVIGSGIIMLSIIYWYFMVKPVKPSLLRLGSVCSIIYIGLHSVVDFNLQIPGTAAYFWVAVGCLVNLNCNRKVNIKKRISVTASLKANNKQTAFLEH